MGIFSRIKSKQGAVGVEPSATSNSSNFLIAAARVQSAHYPSHVRKASLDIGGLPSKSEAPPGLQTTLGVERADSFDLGVGAPLPPRNVVTATPQQSQHARQQRRPQIDFTSLAQFSSRVELYRGSISTVYKAQCLETQETVIIKIYERAKMKAKHEQRLQREIRLMRQLQGSEGVVQLYGSFEDERHVSLVMEHCTAGDLFKTMLVHGGVLDEHWVAIQVVAPLLQVLVRLHIDRIVHRDIKPENLFLTRKRQLKLGDLGLAIVAAEELPFTRSGTLDYMAPEVLANPSAEVQEAPGVTREQLRERGIRPYDEKVDVWAVGILAFELLVGKPPFEVDDEARTVNMILTCTKIPFPTRHSPMWADFVRQALEKRPHLRPTAAALLEHPWLVFHQRKHARESGHVPAVESLKNTKLPAIPTEVKAAHRGEDQKRLPTHKADPARRSQSMGGTALQGALAAQLKQLDPAGRHHQEPSLDHLVSAAPESSAKAGFSADVSFHSLLQAVPAAVHVPGKGPLVHDGDFLQPEDGDAGERAKGGIRTRMHHYFQKQKNVVAPATIAS